MAGVSMEKWPTYMAFQGQERAFDPMEVAHPWLSESWWLVGSSLTCYLILVFYIRPTFFSKDEHAWKLKNSMRVWNLLLGVFSMIGFSRVFPALMARHTESGLAAVVCDRTGVFEGPQGMWLYFFIVSKLWELFDTFFLVVGVKPVILLHWYHHVSVLIYCWTSYETLNPNGQVFCAMNYFVHSVMYTYYCLTLFKGMRWIKVFAPLITFVQILQMVVGLWVCVVTYQEIAAGNDCAVTWHNALFGGLMYLSYFLLFTEMALKRYCGCKAREKKE